MKQKAVEFLQDCLNIHFTFEQQMQFEGLSQQAKEMEKQQQDEFAIKFADWVNLNAYKYPTNTTTTNLLEIFKNK